MATTRRHRTGTSTPSRPKLPTARSRRGGGDSSQLLIIGACILLVGVIAGIGIAIGAHNDTHPAVRWLPAIPIVGGLVLLFFGLARVSSSRGRGEPAGEGLEPR